VIDPRPVFPKRKPEDAMDLLDRARFGQTEVGSFVLTLECTIAPRLQQPLLADEGDEDAPSSDVPVSSSHALFRGRKPRAESPRPPVRSSPFVRARATV
jgi:hypothetical protein